MLRIKPLILTAALSVFLDGAAAAQVPTISTSGSPAAMTISTAIAGSQPASVGNSATTYTTTNVQNGEPQKITAQLNVNMPVGLTLTASLAVGALATSVGPVALDVTARNVVIAIDADQIAQTITYRLTALASAGVIPSQTRTVTFTIALYP